MSRQSESIADDIVLGLRAVTNKWAKQRKQEERQASAITNRTDRLLRSSRETIKDVAWQVMERAYLTASNNGTLPANARQVMYAARPEIQQRSGEQLDDHYFTQTLLPDYIEKNETDWDVVFDDRGHFSEPHTGRTIGLGTLKTRKYQAEISPIGFKDPSFAPGKIITFGPEGCFSAVLFVEKEGFMPLFDAIALGDRFDIAIMSTKGQSVIAARKLLDEMCGDNDIPLFVLHDFDKSGFSIRGTLQRDSRRYTFVNDIEVIDLGLRLEDISGLQSEAAFDKGSRSQRASNLRTNGATAAEVDFLLDSRVELNAMTSDQLVAFVERKLNEHGIEKVVASGEQLQHAYRLFAHSRRVQRTVEHHLRDRRGADDVGVPHDLEDRVREYLARNPKARWDTAVQQIEAGQ